MIVVEDLHVKGLSMNKKLSRYWFDLAHGMFRNMLAYKTELYGSLYVEVPRFFPSSKLCSNCLQINHNLTLKDRVFICPCCGTILDRDVNAAINLVNYYHWYASQLNPSFENSFTVVESSLGTLTACGEDVRLSPSKPTSKNQEQIALQ